MVIHASVEYEATGTLCAEDEDVRYRVEFDGTSGRAVFQSVRCRPGSRETFCLVREGSPYSLWRFSRALDALRYRQFGGNYSYLSRFTTRQITLTTTAEWRDGTRRTVESYGRQGPLAVWTAQQLFLTLMNETRWEREFRRATCDMMQ